MDTEPRTLGGKALKKQRDGSMKQHQKHWGGGGGGVTTVCLGCKGKEMKTLRGKKT